MPSPLTIAIGRNSQNEVQHIELTGGKQLFVSYSMPAQLSALANALSKLIETNADIIFQTAMHSRNAGAFSELMAKGSSWNFHFYDQPDAGAIKTRRAFIEGLHKVFKSRIKRNEAREKFAPCIAFIDDIWALTGKITKNKAEQFLELLINSHAANIMLVVTSPTSYRNLLDHLVRTNRTGGEISGMPSISGIYQVGAEIIYTPDDLVFYRPVNSMTVQHYYKL